MDTDWRRLVPPITPVGRALEIDSYVLYAVTLVVHAIFFYWLLRGGRCQKMQEAVERRVERPVLKRPACLLLYFILYHLALLPIAYIRYLIYHHYGIAVQSNGRWMADILRGWMVNACVIIPVLLVLLRAMRRWPRRWWLAAAAVTSLVSFTMIYVAPLVIDPLFHRFTVLRDVPLRNAILDLAREAHVHVNGVYVGQFSSTTTEGNAYVTGLGNSQRIVLWDTILKQYPPRELTSIVAHELGHYALHHILIGALLGVFGGFVVFYLIHRILLLGQSRGWPFRTGEPAIIVPLTAAAILLNLIAMPVTNAISRTMERQADAFSLKLTHNPAAFIASMQRLSRQDYNNPWPNPVLEFIFYTHPSISERIHAAFMEERKKQGAQASRLQNVSCYGCFVSRAGSIFSTAGGTPTLLVRAGRPRS